MVLKCYAKRTIATYLSWIKTFTNYHHKQHLIKYQNAEVEQSFSYLANQRSVSPNTQALALNALVFLYKEILKKPLTLALNFNRTKIQPKLSYY